MTHQPEIFDKTAIQSAPSFARAHPALAEYWNDVLSPCLAEIADDSTLIAFLNLQVEEWEVVSDGLAPPPDINFHGSTTREVADLIIGLLQDALAVVFLRKTAQISAARAA